jgi:hypothetical protein
MLAATLGWLGTVGTFVAYVLVFRGRLIADSWRYGVLNAVGGTLGGMAAVLYGAWPSAVSNFVWASVGLVTVASATKDRWQLPAREKDHALVPAASLTDELANEQCCRFPDPQSAV